MRLFIGIRPDGAFRAALGEWQAQLSSCGVTGRYQAADNLHLTLAFIGEWPDADEVPLPAVQQSFRIALSHPGIFTKAKVLWAGTVPSAELQALADTVRQGLDRAGVPYDRQPFFPHITLVRKPWLPEGLDLASVPLCTASMAVERVCLYRSERGEGGMEYTVIREGP